ncbi:MAG: hypothetical protein H7Y31_08030 [Chitinophagaceae bacterium]|nr:hypothetical protein [Chitinophagaceae bacterium]
MKNFKLYLFALAIPLFMIACNKNDDNDPPQSVADAITDGTWRVHYLFNDGTDQSGNYSGYVFKFDTDGSVSAEKAGDNTAGTWSEVLDSGKKKLLITWIGGGIPSLLLEIEEDWVVKSKSTTLIQLTYNNDELHFQKL